MHQPVQRIMQRAVQIAGIKELATPYSLRHSYATHSFENGCNMRDEPRVAYDHRSDSHAFIFKVDDE